MKTMLLILITSLCSMTFMGFGQLGLFDHDDESDISWDDINDDLWP